MNMTRISRITVLILAVILTDIGAAAAAPSLSPDSNTVVVEASGNAPGFTSAQLTTYLVRRMHEETPPPWQFSARKPGAASAPNRVVWSFKSLHVEWKPGAHKGFPTPTNSVTYLSAEVKLYLKDIYQITMITQPSVSGGPDDAAVEDMVHNVAHSLFVQNEPGGD
jgi:hypothetical protein